jgi:hypothetical protein
VDSGPLLGIFILVFVVAVLAVLAHVERRDRR